MNARACAHKQRPNTMDQIWLGWWRALAACRMSACGLWRRVIGRQRSKSVPRNYDTQAACGSPQTWPGAARWTSSLCDVSTVHYIAANSAGRSAICTFTLDDTMRVLRPPTRHQKSTMATDVQSQLSRRRYGANGDSQYGTHGFLILSPQSDVKGHTLAIGAHAQNENARLC